MADATDGVNRLVTWGGAVVASTATLWGGLKLIGDPLMDVLFRRRANRAVPETLKTVHDTALTVDRIEGVVQELVRSTQTTEQTVGKLAEQLTTFSQRTSGQMRAVELQLAEMKGETKSKRRRT